MAEDCPDAHKTKRHAAQHEHYITPKVKLQGFFIFFIDVPLKQLYKVEKKAGVCYNK